MANNDGGGDAMDVSYVANLARLSLTPAETATFQAQLDHVLAYVRKIRQLDLNGVEPTLHAAHLENVFRPDVERGGLDRERVLANAPAHSDEQLLVPRIVE